MGAKKKGKGRVVPAHRLHKASGQGVVSFNRHDYYTGTYGTPEAEAEYRRLLAEHFATGAMPATRATGPTVGELAQRYAAWAAGRFTKRGRATSYAHHIGWVADSLVRLYGDTKAADFGPTALRALRSTWTAPGPGVRKRRGVCRGTANQYQRVVVRMFGWAVGQELLPPEVVARLREVEGLAKGRDGVPDHPPVRPADWPTLERTLAHMSPTAADVLRLMEATGMRPAEACSAHESCIERDGPVWLYHVDPDWNKTEHRDRGRTVPIGPRGQAVLGPRLRPGAYAFPPDRGRHKGSHYRPQSLGMALTRACRRAGVPHTTPNQVRHLAATRIRKVYGIEAARVVLGHSDLSTTEIYAEADMQKAMEIAEKLG